VRGLKGGVKAEKDALLEAERVIPGTLIRPYMTKTIRRESHVGQRSDECGPNMMFPAPTKTTLKTSLPRI
jgi:hypothetical protein